MKSSSIYLYALISGLLLALGWFPHGFVPLIFIAFAPLLMAEHIIFLYPEKYGSLTIFKSGFIAFFIWNLLTTWWIKNASYGGAVMAIVSNTLLMTMVFVSFHNIKKRIGEPFGTLAFIAFWITFEFIHHQWDITWPWLTLGNIFAEKPNWVQWYEYTGVFGGSLWILSLNAMFVYGFRYIFKAKIVKSIQEETEKKGIIEISEEHLGESSEKEITDAEDLEKTLEALSQYNFSFSSLRLSLIIAVIVLPLIASSILYSMYENSSSESKRYNIVIVQPNIDPYNEKFNGSTEEQVQKMLHLAATKTDTSTDYLLFPETALSETIWEQQLEQSSSIQTVRQFLKHYPKLKIIVGASTAKVYQEGEDLSETARKFSNDNSYYDYYNTALQVDNSDKIQIYHKSKLVPGVEKMPFPFIFKYFEKFAIDLGGTAGSLGTQNERTVFTATDKSSVTAPVVCYESVYGEYVSEYVNNGAQFISIITNDGWWGDTPGYKQHLKYAALRAIETRRWIARSANTGISCFINPVGEIIQATDWWTPAAISGTIEPNTKLTFYTRFGDYIARTAMYLSILLIIYSLLIRFRIIKREEPVYEEEEEDDLTLQGQ